MAGLLKCFIKLIASLFAWVAWLGFTVIAGVLGGILDLFWTGYDYFVRPTTPSWNPLNWIIPPHPPFDLIKKILDLSSDFGSWIIEKFYHDCMG